MNYLNNFLIESEVGTSVRYMPEAMKLGVVESYKVEHSVAELDPQEVAAPTMTL